MKKSVLMIALAFGVTGAFAQDLTSKKGEPILPEAGDWAISLDASPIFQFVGNAFNGTGTASGTTNAAPSVGWLNTNQTIVAKKFIDEKTAYRALVRVGFTNQTYKNMVSDDANTAAIVFPALPPMVEDKLKIRSTNIAIGVGKEMRKGKTRLQGFYGADAMIWVANSHNIFDYGNTMSPATAAGTTTTPTSTQWTQSSPGVYSGAFSPGVASGTRVTDTKSGMTFGIGVRGFIGAEYFLFPKISVGAEFGWGIGYQMTGNGSTTTQLTGGVPTLVGTQDVKTSGTSKFGFDTDLNQGNIFGFKGSNTGTASLKFTMHF